MGGGRLEDTLARILSDLEGRNTGTKAKDLRFCRGNRVSFSSAAAFSHFW